MRKVVSWAVIDYKPPEGLVAEWLRSGLQIRVLRFESGRGLQQSMAWGSFLTRAHSREARGVVKLLCIFENLNREAGQ